MTRVSELGAALASVGAQVSGDGSVGIADLKQDSRRVKPGDLFVALPGARAQGSAFIRHALDAGAVAVLAERGSVPAGSSVPLIEVADIRRAAALAAEVVHGHPSQRLGVVGITGTNGKTTTAALAAFAIDAAGGRAGRIGTLGFAFGGQDMDSALTTPQADDISRFAAQIAGRGGTHLVMEVSSHALELGRVSALRFAVAAFTNLTQDHLDYHGSMQAYAAAKQRLFVELEPGASVINVDDAFGAELGRVARGRVVRVSRLGTGDVHVAQASIDAAGIRARVRTPGGEVSVATRLVGEHNLDNVLLTLGIVEALGLDVGRAAAALGDAPDVPGRLERCDAPGDDVVVLVDYAHTPDALRRVLGAVRAPGAGAVICVFGCGGDRDPGKRPRMGAVVGELADRAFITNDNPRSEPPARIAAAIEAGLRGGCPYEIELDRARAIERAILEARPGDLVLLAGKGHEPYQIIGSERHAFDDRVEARRALALRRERLREAR